MEWKTLNEMRGCLLCNINKEKYRENNFYIKPVYQKDCLHATSSFFSDFRQTTDLLRTT